MTRRIVFYVPFNATLRVVAPVLAELVRGAADRATVTVALPAWPVSKIGLQPNADDITRHFGSGVRCRALERPEDLEGVLRDADVFVTQSLEMAQIADPEVRRLRQASRAWGVTWVALPYLLTQDHYPILKPEFTLDTWDVICTAGRASIAYIESATRDWAPSTRQAWLDRLVVTGYTAFDGIRELPAPVETRRRYGLGGVPIICLGTAPSMYPLNSGTYCVRGLHARFRDIGDWSPRGVAGRLASYKYPSILDYRAYLEAIRRVADARGAAIVAKSRRKHDDPVYLGDYADHVVGDDSFYPTSTLELLSISDLYFGFHSWMAMEAIVTGVYAMTAFFHPPAEVEHPEWQPWIDHFGRRAGGIWNLAGVSESFSGVGREAGGRLRAVEQRLMGTPRIDQGVRERFLADHFNWPCHASAQAVSVLMDDAQSRPAASLS